MSAPELICRMWDLFIVAWELLVVASISMTRDHALAPLHWECRVLATGSPGKSPLWYLSLCMKPAYFFFYWKLLWLLCSQGSEVLMSWCQSTFIGCAESSTGHFNLKLMYFNSRTFSLIPLSRIPVIQMLSSLTSPQTIISFLFSISWPFCSIFSNLYSNHFLKFF